MLDRALSESENTFSKRYLRSKKRRADHPKSFESLSRLLRHAWAETQMIHKVPLVKDKFNDLRRLIILPFIDLIEKKTCISSF